MSPKFKLKDMTSIPINASASIWAMPGPVPSLQDHTLSIMASCMVEDSIIQDTIVPSNRKTVYMILLEVELRHDGQQAQQHLAAALEQQHST